MVCPHCQANARFVGYRGKALQTTNGGVDLSRAYYHCRRCRQGHCPFDHAAGLQADHLSPGLRPLVALAGTLDSFGDAAQDILRRFLGLRLSANTVRRCTEEAGARLRQRQRGGDVVRPAVVRPWDFRLAGHSHTVAYLGLDAFSVPMQGAKGARAKHRMLYTAILYTPDKKRSLYLADFELDAVAAQMRAAATAYGLGRADQVVAISDGGNGLEEALRRHFWEDMLCILDWYHASQHLHNYAKALHPADEAAAQAWAAAAKEVLYEQGGTALLDRWRSQEAPAEPSAAEEWRKLVQYFADNEHRTDYPSYRSHGWDIGSGPVEAACKVLGERLKESGMRWHEPGAAQVAPLRALYQSGPDVWDAFWALAV
jgi:hypothetical protein